jgi:hypothetical protein
MAVCGTQWRTACEVMQRCDGSLYRAFRDMLGANIPDLYQMSTLAMGPCGA